MEKFYKEAVKTYIQSRIDRANFMLDCIGPSFGHDAALIIGEMKMMAENFGIDLTIIK